MVGRSPVWLSKIERGERPIDKMSILDALANVLK
ncbi:MAG: helix-turn-helix domain-containing protein, partial [Egibacteraceae bacterium]